LKEFSWKDWNETSLEKFVKEIGMETKRNQWQRQQENFGKHRVKRSAPRSGQKMKEYSSSEARSMFSGTRTYGGEWSCCATIQRSLDIPNAGKHWS